VTDQPASALARKDTSRLPHRGLPTINTAGAIPLIAVALVAGCTTAPDHGPSGTPTPRPTSTARRVPPVYATAHPTAAPTKAAPHPKPPHQPPGPYTGPVTPMPGVSISYSGGPVQHHVRIHLIFWGGAWESSGADLIAAQDRLFASLDASPWTAILQQYRDHNGAAAQDVTLVLRPGLAAVTVGINPAPISVAAGHYYQGRAGQTFYRRLASVGLLPAGSAYQDDRAYAGGIGFSDVVKRPTRSAEEIHPGELAYGRPLLEDKLKKTGTPLVIFTFKKAATALLGDFAGHGLLSPSRRLAGARVFVMPGPYEQSDRVAAALDELKRHLDP
jgi:TDG/mug DNA glycosylase family protein